MKSQVLPIVCGLCLSLLNLFILPCEATNLPQTSTGGIYEIEDLIAPFRENQYSGMRRLQNREFSIQGTVSRIGLEKGEGVLLLSGNRGGWAKCYMRGSDGAQLAEVREFDRVKVTGLLNNFVQNEFQVPNYVAGMYETRVADCLVFDDCVLGLERGQSGDRPAAQSEEAIWQLPAGLLNQVKQQPDLANRFIGEKITVSQSVAEFHYPGQTGTCLVAGEDPVWHVVFPLSKEAFARLNPRQNQILTVTGTVSGFNLRANLILLEAAQAGPAPIDRINESLLARSPLKSLVPWYGTELPVAFKPEITGPPVLNTYRLDRVSRDDFEVRAMGFAGFIADHMGQPLTDGLKRELVEFARANSFICTFEAAADPHYSCIVIGPADAKAAREREKNAQTESEKRKRAYGNLYPNFVKANVDGYKSHLSNMANGVLSNFGLQRNQNPLRFKQRSKKH